MKKDGSEKNIYDARLNEMVNSALQEGIFPGAVVAVAHGLPECRRTFMRAYGHAALLPFPRAMEEGTFFDLASLTKPLVTSLAILCLIKEGILSFDQTLPSLLERVVPESKNNITLARLLGHCSGLPAHRPYFEQLLEVPPEDRPEKLVELVLKEPLEYEAGSKTVYSDIGFMLLGRIMEIKTAMNLGIFARQRLFEPLGLSEHLFFRPLVHREREAEEGRFAATEKCAWRGRILCGEVHDDNAFALGGEAGHAGLFGDAAGVLTMALALLDQWKGRSSHPGYYQRDLNTLLRRQDIQHSSWGLGFDTPSQEGYSSGGSFLSRSSVGHLGFTGTSFWIDPEKELVVVLLTNRIHPDRHHESIRAFRPLFHDAVLTAIASSG